MKGIYTHACFTIYTQHALNRATIGKYLTGKIVFKSTLKGLQKMKDSALRYVDCNEF